MSLAETPARAGHNSADEHAAAFADFQQRIAAFLQGADVWDKRAAFDEHDAEKANDFITGAKRLKAQADKARAAEKQPHLDAGREIDARWKGLDARLDKIIAVVQPKLKAFLDAKKAAAQQVRIEAAAKAAEAERRAKAAEADAAAAATASARIAAEERAEAERRAAEAARDSVAANSGPVRVGSATGLANHRGLKLKRVPVIVSMAQALAHYRDEPELAELIERLAARDLREAPARAGVKQIPAIPGIRFEEKEDLA